MIRKAVFSDIDAVANICEEIHREEEAGHATTGKKYSEYFA